jgi:hypothetical protein
VLLQALQQRPPEQIARQKGQNKEEGNNHCLQHAYCQGATAFNQRIVGNGAQMVLLLDRLLACL